VIIAFKTEVMQFYQGMYEKVAQNAKTRINNNFLSFLNPIFLTLLEYMVGASYPNLDKFHKIFLALKLGQKTL
jgi:hypothetical protein